MFETIAELNVPYIMMHMKGDSLTMQNNPVYENIISEIIMFSIKKYKLKSMGFNKIIIDPGLVLEKH